MDNLLPVSRFVAGVLVSKWCPNIKMDDLLPGSWYRSGAPILRWTICCWCLGLEVVPQYSMCGLLPGSWSRSGAPTLRCTMYCRYLGFEAVPQHVAVRLADGVLVSKWQPSIKMYDVLPVSWSVLVSWCPTKIYELLPGS